MPEPLTPSFCPSRRGFSPQSVAAWIRGPGGRVLLIVMVVGLIVGYPVYQFVDSTITGGISRRGDLYVLDLYAMSAFEMDQVRATDQDIPQKWRDMDGKRVQLTGEMWAPYSAGGQVAGFQLCYSIAKCCFNGPPKVQHFVQASVPERRSAKYYSGLVKVVGKLHVGVERSQDRVRSIYRLEVESVDPV